MQSKRSLVCSMCGAEDLPGCGALSSLTLSGGYGSVEHDMESVSIRLCGQCCDKLFGEMSRCRGAVVESPWNE